LQDILLEIIRHEQKQIIFFVESFQISAEFSNTKFGFIKQETQGITIRKRYLTITTKYHQYFSVCITLK
jgi:hypothetical protein